MSGFTADWLSLREPADRAARDQTLVRQLAGELEQHTGTGLTIVDLGSGSGSNLRALAPNLPGPQRWRLVDDDADLLEIGRGSASTIHDRDGRSLRVETQRADLAKPGWDDVAEGATLITMSALLDLVGTDFITQLAGVARALSAPIYAALTVDGRISCAPADALDAQVFDAFHRHMAGNKGFGAACGPDAPSRAHQILTAHGFAVAMARSDWTIGSDMPALAAALVEGWVAAAHDTGLVDRARLTAWAELRQSQIARASLDVRVGHVDLFARPT